MVIAIFAIFRHLTTNLLKDTIIEMEFSEKLSIAIVNSLHLPKHPRWRGMALFFVHVADTVKIMHVVSEATHELRDLRFRLPHVVDAFSDQRADSH